MFDVRLVVAESGRSLSSHFDFNEMTGKLREIGWRLVQESPDVRARFVVLGSYREGSSDYNEPLYRTDYTGSERYKTLPCFWVSPHRRADYAERGIVDWSAFPGGIEPEEHGWSDVGYELSSITGWVRSWLGAVVIGRRLRLFVSYAREDVTAAREVTDSLASRGHDVWLDERRLLPGQDWDLEVRRAIRASDAVLVLLSDRSTNKVGYVQKEIRAVLDAADERPDGRVFILPIRLDEAAVPDRLGRLHYIDMVNQRWLAMVEASLDLVRRNPN